jgi:hypothetical protein
MRLSLVLDTDNAAFDGDNLGPEVSRILIKYANAIKEESARAFLIRASLKDTNGNTVGNVLWIE